MHKSLIIAAILLSVGTTVFAKERVRPSDYKGKVFKEVRIDDKGIILIDSLGNELQVANSSMNQVIDELNDQARQLSDQARLQAERMRETHVPSVPPVPEDVGSDRRDYSDTLNGIQKLGGSVTVDEDQFVDGDVIALGNVKIAGKVNGSVTSTGRVTVASTGIISGSVTATEVEEEPGSRIYGTINRTSILSMPKLPNGDWQHDTNESTAGETVAGFLWVMMHLGITIFIAMLFRKPTDKMKEALSGNIFKSLIIGFLAEIALLPVIVILCITIIGIPVALIAVPLAVVAAGFLGFTSFCLFLSDFVRSAREAAFESRFQKILMGFGILYLPVIGMILGLAIRSQAMAIVFLIITCILLFIVFTASLGATILTRFGTRDFDRSKQTVEVKIEVTPTAT